MGRENNQEYLARFLLNYKGELEKKTATLSATVQYSGKLKIKSINVENWALY